ncbi:nucleotidyl transferase AbiEii/AbiGii toxin family protein [Facklamia sp. P12932]
MNKAKLTAICHKISKETGLPFNSVMLYYFLESILKKLSQSKYHENFVFKGGFLLSNVVGIDSRSTVDIDFLLRNMHLSEENILKILQEALETKSSDDIFYKTHGISTIKEDDQYGGFRVSILCRMENIRQIVPLDIATGDVITPYPIDYKYISAFGQKDILIKAYPIETILAEKIQTIYSRGFLNSRSKDYYDLYIIYKLKDKEIEIDILKEACIQTFNYRKTEFDTDKIISLMEMLKTDEAFLKRWQAYSKKNLYARDIKFEDAIDNGINIIEKI